MTESESDERAAAPVKAPELKTVVRHLSSMILIVCVLIAAGALFLKEPLVELSDWVVARLGLAGMTLLICAGDALSIPVPIDALLFAAATSGPPSILEALALCAASVVAGAIAYHVGPQLARIGWVGRRVEAWRPTGDALFRRWGGWAVAVAAVSPIPYSIVCWLAGIYRTPRLPFLLATLLRVPRIGGVYALCAYGFWAL